MESILVYCRREHASRTQTPYYSTETVIRPSTLEGPRASASEDLTGTIFTLGPFLDVDEACLVEAQLCSLMSNPGDPEGVFYRNPIEVPEFRAWVDAQILPVQFCEVAAAGLCTRPRGGLGRQNLASPKWRLAEPRPRGSSSSKEGRS